MEPSWPTAFWWRPVAARHRPARCKWLRLEFFAVRGITRARGMAVLTAATASVAFGACDGGGHRSGSAPQHPAAGVHSSSTTAAAGAVSLTQTLSPACRGGATPLVGQARAGASVAFGALPAGWSTSPPSPEASVRSIQTAAPGGAAGSPDSLTVQLYVASPLTAGLESAHATSAEVQGRPAQVVAGSSAQAAPVTVTWDPSPGMIIELQGTGLSTAEVEDVAQHVRYTPGVTAPSVGDQGPVVPRAAVLAAVDRSDPDPIYAQHAVLVTSTEYRRAAPALGSSGPSGADPLWVVEITHGGPGSPAPQRPTAPDEVVVYDAVTGDFLSQVSGTDLPTINLADHSGRQPCPIPVH